MTDAPIDGPTDEMVESEPLGDDDVVIENESSGNPTSRGGGEFPDPDTPPSGVAPADGASEHGQGQFAEAYEAIGSERAGVGSIAEEPDEDDDQAEP